MRLQLGLDIRGIAVGIGIHLVVLAPAVPVQGVQCLGKVVDSRHDAQNSGNLKDGGRIAGRRLLQPDAEKKAIRNGARIVRLAIGKALRVIQVVMLGNGVLHGVLLRYMGNLVH